MYINKLYEYPILKRIKENNKHFYTVDNAPLPSVTSILSKTKCMKGINAWRKRVGEEEAHRILVESANIGTLTHKHLENYCYDKPRPDGSNIIRNLSLELSNIIIENGLKKINEIWGLEVALYSPNLYAGTTDCVGIVDKKPTIIDFKTSRSIKKREWIEDYFLQGVAYALAHNELFNTEIKKVTIMMVTHVGDYLEFTIEDKEFEKYQYKWLYKLNQYYDK